MHYYHGGRKPSKYDKKKYLHEHRVLVFSKIELQNNDDYKNLNKNANDNWSITGNKCKGKTKDTIHYGQHPASTYLFH